MQNPMEEDMEHEMTIAIAVISVILVMVIFRLDTASPPSLTVG